jgi:hypothetical protein
MERTMSDVDEGWTPQGHFAEFWARPDAGRRVERKHEDVIGYWPGGVVVRGRAEYNAQLVRLVTALPGLRLSVLEHATNGTITFIRWEATWEHAHGTGRFEGVDRLVVEQRKIRENRILFDTSEFEHRAGFPLPGPAESRT